MASIIPYFTFNGNAKEAMTFYQECFGGELQISLFSESPGAEELPEEYLSHVMHASLLGESLSLMASDTAGQVVATMGNGLSLSLDCSTEAEIKDLFSKLSVGAEITMPLGKQFWGAYFGMLIDKFGVSWMLNWDENSEEA